MAPLSLDATRQQTMIYLDNGSPAAAGTTTTGWLTLDDTRVR